MTKEIVEDNGKSVEVTLEELDSLRFLVTRGGDGKFHPHPGVAWGQIESAIRWSGCVVDGD